MFSYFKNKKANKRRGEYIDDVKSFIQVHFVRERSSERYKYNTLTLKDDPERDACKEWYISHDNPSTFSNIVKIYMSEKKLSADSITSPYKVSTNTIVSDDISKGNAVAICLGLHLNLAETKQLLKSVGHAITNSSEPDLVIRYCIENNIYDFDDIEYLLSSICSTSLQELL